MFYHLPWRQKLPLYDLVRVLFAGIIGYFSFAVMLGLMMRFVKTLQVIDPADFRQYSAVLSSSIQLPVLLLLLYLIHAAGQSGNLADKLGIRVINLRDLKLAFTGLLQIYLFGFAAQLVWKFMLQKLHIPFVEEQGLTDLIKLAGPLPYALMIVTVVLAAPVCEELFFRRLLYDLLYRACGRYAIIVTSLIFAVIHWFIFGVPLLFIVGFFCQKQYLMSRNLATPIMMHMLFNAVTLAVVGLDLKQ